MNKIEELIKMAKDILDAPSQLNTPKQLELIERILNELETIHTEPRTKDE